MLLQAAFAPSLRSAPTAIAHGSFSSSRAPSFVMAELKDESVSTEDSLLADRVSLAGFQSANDIASQTFTRASDVFGTGERVTAVEVVNVLGRWKRHTEWESLGVLVEMDKLFDESGNVYDGPALQRAWERWDAEYVTGKDPKKIKQLTKNKTPEFRRANLPVWVASNRQILKRDPLFGDYKGAGGERLTGPQPDASRSAARRGFCIRRKQVQRWWHNENIADKQLLPFTDEALAASVGCTAAELNAVAPTWEACDVVFDALSRSMSGIMDKELIDERRAAYQSEADGSFDAEAFAADLAAGKRTVATSLAIFPGSLNLVFLIAFIQANGLEYVLQAQQDVAAQVAKNVALWSSLFGGS